MTEVTNPKVLKVIELIQKEPDLTNAMLKARGHTISHIEQARKATGIRYAERGIISDKEKQKIQEYIDTNVDKRPKRERFNSGNHTLPTDQETWWQAYNK